MSETPNPTATQTATATEVANIATLPPLTPAPTGDVVPYEQAEGVDKSKIEELIVGIDLTDAQSIIGFGAKAQSDLRSVTGQMLDGVRNKEAGQAGQILNEVVLSVRGFDLSGLSEKPGFLAPASSAPPSRWRGCCSAMRPCNGRSTVCAPTWNSTKTICCATSSCSTGCTKARWPTSTIWSFTSRPARKSCAGSRPRRSRPPRQAAEGDDPLKSQALQRLIAAKNDLERKVHDLKLTRQVTMQSLPSIRAGAGQRQVAGDQDRQHGREHHPAVGRCRSRKP